MDTLQSSVLALFYITATAGYAWVTVSRSRRERGVAPIGSAKAVQAAPLKSNEANLAQTQPAQPAAQGKGKMRVDAHSIRVSRFAFLHSLLPRRSLGPKPPIPSTEAAKAPTPRRSFRLWNRKAAAPGGTAPEAKSLQQKGRQPQAQQQVLVEPSHEVPDAQDRILIDSYSVKEPFVRIVVSQEPDGSKKYIVIEPTMTKKERAKFAELKRALRDGLDFNVAEFNSEKAVAYLSSKTKEIIDKFKIKIPPATLEKIFYFLERDFLHYGKVDPIMLDPNIEDISCNGPETPIFIYHRNYESMPTSVRFKTQEELEKFVMRLAYMSGRHISVADPVVDAALPDGSRVQMTFGSEITKRGSTFTIRKFKADPYSVVDMLRFGTITADIAALLWYALENKSSVLLAGGTASGKSILGSEDVFVHEHGVPRLVKISELFDQLARTRAVRNDNGYETVECTGIETAAFDNDLKVRPFRVKGVVRHSAPSRVFRLETRSGRTVSVTGDHSVFTLVDGRVQPYPVSELEPGMFLAVPRTLPDAPSSTAQLNLVEAFGEEDFGLYVEDVKEYVKRAVEILGTRAVESILRISHKSFLITFKRDSIAVRVSCLRSLARATGLKLDPSGLSLRAKNNRKGSIPALIPVSNGLMRFLGYWVAEGMYQQQVKIFQLNDDVRHEITRIVGDVFGLKVRYHRQDRTRMDMNSYPLQMLLRHVFGLEGGAGRKKIPSLVLGEQNELLAEFLKAYYTGDGSMAGGTIEATTKSRDLAYQLLYALSRFGIVARTTPKVVGEGTYHRVSIYGRKNVERFSQFVGFLNSSNTARLAAYLNRNARVHTNIDTIPGVGLMLKQCLQFKEGAERKNLWSDWHSYWSSEKRIGHQSLVSFVEATGAEGELRNRLLALAYSDLFWDEVTEIEEVECKDAYVYDLEVPGAQNFVGGSGGLFLHNTTSINCLALFIRPEAKIVTMEDTPEINLAHKNWIQSVSRQGIAGMGEVTLYDLLRAALRQRPDFIIPGEVRGEEAQTMFQAISTGHAGMSSIHADSVPAVFHRLTNPPMSIPRTLLPALNFVILQGRVTVKGRPVRRVLSVTEVVGLDPRSNELITNEIYKFNAESDDYTYSGRCYTLEKLAKSKGVTMDEVKQELTTRRQILQWMSDRGMRRYREVADMVQRYYTDKPSLLAELGAIAA